MLLILRPLINFWNKKSSSVVESGLINAHELLNSFCDILSFRNCIAFCHETSSNLSSIFIIGLDVLSTWSIDSYENLSLSDNQISFIFLFSLGVTL